MKRNIQTICVWLLVAALVAASAGVMTYLFVPPEFTRAKIHSIETGRYDIVVFGTSHGACAFDPDVITEMTGKTCYNAAAGGLYPESMYYLVEDVLVRGNCGEILFEFDPTYWLTESGGNPNEYYALHHMAPSLAKLRFFLSCAVKRDFRFTLMPWYMFERSAGAAKENLAKKRSEAFREYKMSLFSSGMNEARENGFFAVKGTYGTGNTVPLYDAFAGRMVEENCRHFEKILALCGKRNVPVRVVMTPVPEETAAANEAFYETASELMRDIAKKYNVTYYDFVTAEGEGCPMPEHAYYDMEGHMHAQGAEAFSKTLGGLMKEKETL